VAVWAGRLPVPVFTVFISRAVLCFVQLLEDDARRAAMADDYDDDDDDDHSPSAGSAASIELYQSVRGIVPDGHIRDKDQISMKSDCATGMRRRLSILNTHEHKVCELHTH